MSLADENSVENNLTATIADAPVNPRLCHLKKWPHFQGYGFNLHAERAKTGQHIGKVDADSPAESAGLLEGDRIIEVNGVNISNENHQQVVKRIRNGLELDGKLYDDEVVLLVLDSEADAYYRTKNIIVKADFKEVIKLSTKSQTDENNNNQSWNPVPNSDKTQQQEQPLESPVSSVTKLTDTTNTQQDSKSKLVSNSLSSVSQKSTASVHIDRSETENETENLRNASATSLSIEHSKNKELVSSASNLSVSSNNQSNSSKATTPNIQTKNVANSYAEQPTVEKPVVDIYEQNSIDRRSMTTKENVKTVDPFQMSASEFKNYLKSKSRADPRIAQVDMRQKYQMFQDM